MITLETGVPGAGKTLYCVDKLLLPMVGATVKHENSDGQLVEIPRIIYTNINGLLLEHEKIGPEQLMNWHTWAKPGSLIVYDEIQKPWPLAATGSKVPECIQALETHRHMGVDFIVLTQHPMLIHANLVRLVGRHLHVRRMGNMSLAVVYEWDSCSKTLLYKNSLTKSPWKYSKKAQGLYKSAELHTKQPRKIPFLIYFILVGIVGFLALSPSTFTRISERIHPTPVAAKIQSKKTVEVTHTPPPLLTAGALQTGPGLETMPKFAGGQEPVFAGCVAARGLCSCYDSNAKKIQKPADFCADSVGSNNPISLKEIPVTLVEYVPVVPREKDPHIMTLSPKTLQGSTVADVVAKYR